MKTTIAITGNTYPVKDQLKSIGCRWDANRKCWSASTEEMAAKARAIVNKGGSSSSPSQSYKPQTCVACGARASRDARGYPLVKILRSGECVDCYEERKMGY